MEKQKVMDFDFKKVLPIEGSIAEKRISAIVTKKFLLLGFVIALGFGMGYYTLDSYNSQKKEVSLHLQEKQKEDLLIAKENKESILENLESQITMYDDIIKDILEANRLVPNTAQTILNQTDQIRSFSQTYKENLVNIINNVNKLTKSEESFKNSTVEEKELLSKTVKNHRIGSLNRNNELEQVFMSATTTENYDEKKAMEKAKPIREELRKQVIEKMAKLLGSNELTKPKKFKMK